MLMRHALRVVLLAAVAAGVCGCRIPVPRTQVPIEVLVGEYNTNAAKVPRLWARAKIQMTMYHAPTGFPIFTWGNPLLPANGLLLLSKTTDRLGHHNFVLIGRETQAAELFRVGVSADEGVYYMWQRVPEKVALWGRNELAGFPGVKGLPIDPTGVLAVLGVCELPSDFTRLPTVSLTMNTRQFEYAYMLTYLDRQPLTNRIGFRREMHFIWDDHTARRLFKVNFFDTRGRRVMSARVGNYKPIDVSELEDPPADAPLVPTDIQVTWYNDREQKTSRVNIRLAEMTAAKIWKVEACRFRDNLPDDIPAQNVVQVDKGLTAKGSGK